jgi:hypothetical protein
VAGLFANELLIASFGLIIFKNPIIIMTDLHEMFDVTFANFQSEHSAVFSARLYDSNYRTFSNETTHLIKIANAFRIHD